MPFQVASLLSCVVPILPMDFVQDRVQTMMFFEDNPIAPKANKSLLNTILNTYIGQLEVGQQIQINFTGSLKSLHQTKCQAFGRY